MKQHDSQTDYLFVYGSLMASVRSRVARYFHSQAEYIEEGMIPGRLYDLGAYPGLVPGGEDGQVNGHIFRMLKPSILLPFLDEYEGVLGDTTPEAEYRREMGEVAGQEQSYRCWMYLYNQDTDGLPLIEGGNYLNYLHTNPTHLAFLQSLRANG